MMLRGFSCGAAGDWMKTQPLLMLRPPSKALVSESPNAHMRDLELDSMSQARKCQSVSGGTVQVCLLKKRISNQGALVTPTGFPRTSYIFSR